MAEKILAIEIGSKITKVCETEYKGTPAIYHYFTFETPEGMVENQIVNDDERFQMALEELLQRNNIRTRKAVFIIPTIGIGAKEVTIPKMKDAKLHDYVKTNLAGFFPVDAKECHVAFRVNGQTPDGKERVQLYAVNNNIVYAYQALALSCKLTLVDIEFAENGIARAMKKVMPEGVSVNVNVETDVSVLTIMRDGEVELQRSIAYGLEDTIRTLQEGQTFGSAVSYQEALRRMGETDCIFRSFTQMQEERTAQPEKADATEGLRYVISNITRILEYYQSQNQGIAFDHLLLTGFGAGCKGFKELLQNETGYQFGLIDPVLMDIKSKQLDDIVRSVGCAAVVSACAPKGLIRKQQGFDLKKILQEPGDNSTARKLFAICVVISLILVLYPVGRRVVLNSEKVSLKASIASMQEAKKINDEYQKTKACYEELLAMSDATRTPNDALLELLQEMEANIPTDAVATEMEASQEAVAIAFTAPSKSVVAKTIQAFREFQSVRSVSVDSVTSAADEGAEETVAESYTFIITCFYANPTEQEETE